MAINLRLHYIALKFACFNAKIDFQKKKFLWDTIYSI